MKKEKKKRVFIISKKFLDSEIYWLILLCLWEEVEGLLLGLFQSRLTYKRLLLQGVTLKQQGDYLDVPKVWTTFFISCFCNFQMVFCKVLSETV